MSRFFTPVARHLLLALLFMSLMGVAACGGGAGKDDDEEEDPPAPPATYNLTGKILADDGAPIADALAIARMGDGSNALIDTATSAADGTYTVSVPENTAFYIHVAKAGYVSSNSHIREIFGNKTGADVVLLLQPQADSLLSILGGPASFTTANLLFLVRALDSLRAELAGVNVSITPVGLLLFYRLADDTGYTLTGPTVTCTAGGGCSLPQMAGYAPAVNQGISTFRLTDMGGVTLTVVAAPLIPGEVTYIVND